MLVMVEEGWERARDARRVANVVLPMHGWPDRIRDGMLKRATESVVAFRPASMVYGTFCLGETSLFPCFGWRALYFCVFFLKVSFERAKIITNS